MNRSEWSKALMAGAVLGLLATACGPFRAASQLTPESPTPGGKASLVLRIATGGGFVPVDAALREFPELSVYSDGRVVVAGAQVEIYPPPALPPMMAAQLTPSGLEEVRAAAREAGLDGQDRSYEDPRIADAPTTTFTFVDEAGTHTISAYALGFGDDFGQDSPDKDDRRRLGEFREKMADLSWLGEDISQQDGYVAGSMRVFVMAVQDDGQGLQRQRVDWPLRTPLGDFGQALENGAYERCGVAEGDDVTKLYEAAATTNTLTIWTSGDVEKTLVLRPLLPDESGCPDQQ